LPVIRCAWLLAPGLRNNARRLSLRSQLAAPTWRLRGNAILIEGKDDIRKRLGSSTDDVDAVVLAWHKREEALRRQMRTRRLNPGTGLGGWGGPNGWMGN
jgi:hypothetical protein